MPVGHRRARARRGRQAARPVHPDGHPRGGPAEELRAALPGKDHLTVPAALADPAAVRAMVDRAAEALGGLDVVVNGAGQYTPHRISEVSYEDWQAEWRRTIDVNLIGAAN